ncbi:MAG: clan AA aspartic protease [Phormidesmis sp.]
MILGKVNAGREAVVQIVVLNESKQTKVVNALIDTGYTGDLMLPKGTIQALQLSLRGVQEATLGDESVAIFEIYTGSVIWDGAIKKVEINASEVSALIGMGLIENFKLEIEGKLDGQVKLSMLV